MKLFESWQELARVAATGVILYVALITFINLSGKRSTSKMNNFDWVVTVALGSLTASVILVKDIVLLEGLLAIAVLLGLQHVTTKVVSHSRTAEKIIKLQPRLLYFKGRFIEEAMKEERISQNEIMAAIREAGHASLENVTAVILESDASVSVIQQREREKLDTLSFAEDIQ